jgi:hypothetical protein
MMHYLKAALAVAVAVGSSLSITGTADAAIAATGVRAAFDSLTTIERVEYYRYGGRRYCWYGDGWHGGGWYWCGYGRRHGYGWGGEEGWNGWRHR